MKFKILNLSIVFLLMAFLAPQNIFAQSNAEQIIKRYEMGQLINPTAGEKQIISEYLESINKPNNISKEKILSPDATIFYEEQFGPSLVKDNVNYDVGNLTTVGSANWTSFSGTTPLLVTSGSLSYTGYLSSNLYNKIEMVYTNSEDAYIGFTPQGEGTTTYSAFLLNVTDTLGLLDNSNTTGNYFMSYLPSNSTSFYNGRLSIRKGTVQNTFQLGLRANSTPAPIWDATDLAVGTTYLIVLSYQSVAGAANDVTSVWINPPVDGTMPTANLIQTCTTDNLDASRLALRQSSGTPNAAIDGIRIGTSWSELFPTTIPPAGWTNVDNGSSGQIWEFNNPYPRTFTGDFDEDFAILDSDNYGSGGSQNATITTIAVDCGTATTVSLGFDHSFRSYSGSSGTVEVSNDGSTWTTLETITVSSGYPNPPVYKEYDVTSVAAGQSTVYFRWTYVGSYAYWWAIDNVIVFEPDAFPTPAMLVSPLDGATNVALSATLNWMAGGGAAPTGYRINFGTDNPPSNIENNTDLGDTLMYTPTSLSYNTTYYWEIIPYNGAGSAIGTSVWSFTTLDDPTVTTYPFVEGFENGNTDGTAIVGWTQEAVTGTNVWTANNTQTTYNRTPRTGAWNAYLRYGNERWMFKPFQLTGGTSYTFEIYARQDGATATNADITVAYGSSGSAAAMTDTIVATTGIINGNYQRLAGEFTPSVSGIYYIGINGYMNFSPWYISIDDISVFETPSNPIFSVDPTSKDFGTLQIGTSSADQTFTITNIGGGTLSIASGGISIVGTDASQFVLTDNNTYPINLTTGQSATVDVNFSPTTVGAKTADLQIVDNITDATNTVPLSGEGIDATISSFPYTQDFEGATFPPTGWLNYGDKLWSLSTTDGRNGTQGARVSYSPSGAANLQMPPVVLPATPDHRIKFWWKDDDISTDQPLNKDDRGQELIISHDTTYFEISTDGGSTWTILTFLSKASPDTGYFESIQNLSAYAGQTVTFRWRDVSDGSFSAYGTGIDDITIEEAPLGPPAPAVLVSPDSAGTDISPYVSLEWTSGGGPAETNYLINFGTDNPPTNILNNFDNGLSTTYTPTSPLSYGTTYYWEIVAVNGTGNASSPVWSFTTVVPESLPFSEDFEVDPNWDGSMYTLSNHGTAGSFGLTYNLYSFATAADAFTPLVGPLTATTQLEFDYRIVNWSGYPNTATVLDADTFDVQISTDGGSTFTSVFVIDSSNHTTSTSFAHLTIPIGAYDGSVVIVKWDLMWAAGDYYFDIDNVLIREAPVAPIFDIDPTSYDYGLAVVGGSVSQDFVITNIGAGTLTISSGGITLVGADADQFTLDPVTYPIDLLNGESETITVSFTPTSAGDKTADLQIVDNITLDGTNLVPLTGSALPNDILFEDWTAVNALDRWTVVNQDGGANSWQRLTNKFLSAPASAGSYYESGVLQNDDWLISPKLVISSGDSLAFWHSIASSSYPESLYVMIGTTNDPTTGVWDTLDVIFDNTTTWKRKSYDLTAYAGVKEYIAFVNRSLDAFILFVDDIVGPVVYVPAVDLAFSDFYQASGLPTANINGYESSSKQILRKPLSFNSENMNGVHSSFIQRLNPISYEGDIPFSPNLVDISVEGVISNLGTDAASYTLDWTVGGVAQTTYNGPSVASGGSDVAPLTYTPTDRGTFLTEGIITVTSDENTANNDATPFRMRVYPDVFTETIYDDGDDVADTYIGYGSTTIRVKAGVRFMAPASDIKLAGVDFVCRTESVASGSWEIQVRDTSSSPDAPGAVLYEAFFTDPVYFSGAGDYMYFPFDDTAPVIPAGEEYWITIKAPLGVLFPSGADSEFGIPGITAGHSYIEDSPDTTAWFPVVLSGPEEFAWVMRSVEVAAGASTFQLSVDVNDGWNMVSVPGVNPDGQGTTTWWSGLTGDVFAYSAGYTIVTNTTPSEGYWMKHVGANTYNTGDEWPAGGIEIVANDPIPGVAGWNMIGGYENSATVVNITTNPPGLVDGPVYGYNAGYTTPASIDPGYGYWIKLSGAGDIILPSSLAKGTESVEWFKEDWGRIVVTDATGKQFTLYAVNGEVDLNQYEMPPLPPQGMFDIRYNSGRIAEDINSSVKGIDMTGVTYPLTVRVEKMDMRIMDETGKILNENVKDGEEIVISNAQISKLMVSGELLPTVYALEQNYPNPFNPSTTIEFSLPEDVSNVKLSIYSILGEKVAELVNTSLVAGKYQYQWNAQNVATGMYIYELRTDNFVSIKKMMLLK